MKHLSLVHVFLGLGLLAQLTSMESTAKAETSPSGTTGNAGPVAASTTSEARSDPAPSQPDTSSSSNPPRRFVVGNTLTGVTGGLRLAAADSGPVGSFQVAMTESLFFGTGVLCPNCARSDGSVSSKEDQVGFSATRLMLSLTPTPYLEAFTNIRFQSVSNDQNAPKVLQTDGSADLGAKVMMPYRAGRLWTLGGLADLSLLAKNRNVGSAAFNFDLAVVGTVDWRELSTRRGLPFRVHFNGAYRFDNSGAIADDIETRRSRQQGLPQRVTRIERLGFGIRRTDLLRVGLGLEGAFERYRPFTEWSIDLPVNRQGYECKVGLLSAGDDCLSRHREFAAMPSRWSLGLRASPFSQPSLHGLGFLVAVDIGTGGTNTFVEEAIPELPWMAHLGISYTVEPMRPVVNVRPIEQKTVVVEAPSLPPLAYVAGRVVEKVGKDGGLVPVAQALISFKDGSKQGMIANDDGHFDSSELSPGHYVFQVSKGGFADSECSVDVPEPQVETATKPSKEPLRRQVATELVCDLVRLPTTAIVTGVLRDAETTVFVPNAVVSVFDARGRKLSLKTDEFGGFRVEKVIEGSVRIQAEAEGYLMSVSELELKPRENVNVQMSVHKKPKVSNVTVTTKELKLKRPIHFLHDSAEMLPDSFALIEELAEAFRAHPEISLVEIQGHTDDSGALLHNQTLSEKRAVAVRKALISLGIDADRLLAKGYGASQPLVPNTNAANRTKNRRVQLIVQKQ